MAQFVVANNVNTQLAAALPSSGAGSTTVVLASSANLPTLNTATGQMMPLTLNDAATGAIYETVYVTAISGATLTVLRGQEGTSALNWSVGDFAFCAPTAGTTGLTTMRTQYQASAAFSSSQTLTAAIAGESIGFTGTSAATFSMPGQSTVPALTPTAVYNDGTAALTLTANGSDKFVVATGQVTSIVMQPGDDLTFYASTTAGLWTAASGSALRQYEPLVVGTATQPAHAVQLGQVAVFGAVRNLKASLAATGTSLTFTADAVVVKSALNGISTLLTSFNQTVSTAAGTGAGKMDTGTAPVSGYVAVYASWGPVVGAGAFLQNATSAAASEQYGGANLPAGVTETQLIGVWPTNGSGQFAVGFQEDRSVSITFVGVLSSTVTQASPTALSISSAVPANAKVAIGTIAASSTAASNMSVSVFASSAAVGQQGINFISSAAGSSISTGYRVPISTSQNLFYIAVNTAGTPTFSMTVTGYEF